MICHPDVGSVKGDAVWLVSYGESALQGAIAGSQLDHVVTLNVCHPDIRSVKGDAVWMAPDVECGGQVRPPLEQRDLQRVDLPSRRLHKEAADAEQEREQEPMRNMRIS